MSAVVPIRAATSEALPCPICGAHPDVDETDLRNGWYAGCYSLHPKEHYVGADGDTRVQAVTNWNAEVRRLASEQAKERPA